MATGRIVRVWRDGDRVYIAARVVESHGAVEYVAGVAQSELAGLTTGQQRARLAEAVRAERDRALAMANVELDISGGVTV